MNVGRRLSYFRRLLYLGVATVLFVGRAFADTGQEQAARVSTEGSRPSGYVLWIHASPEADDCPSAPELRRRITERLGQDPFRDGTEPGPAMYVSFTRVGSTYYARLSLSGADASVLERRFEDRAENCRHLADALVLGVTLLLEGGIGTTTNVAATASPTPVVVVAPATPVVVVAPPQTKASERTAVHRNAETHAKAPSELLMGPALSYGVVSDEGVGWGMGVAGVLYPFGVFGVKLGADYSIGDSFQRGVTHYQFSQTSAVVAAVVAGRLHPRLRIVPELGVMVGALHAAVLTDDPTDPGDFFFTGIRAGAVAQWRCLGPWTLGAGGQLRLPFNRHVFRAKGMSEPVWRQPYIGLLAEFTLGLHFE